MVRQPHARGGSGPQVPGGPRGRPGTSAGCSERWQLLRGRRDEGGPGRRPGGGARPGAGPRGLHLRTHGLLPSAGIPRRGTTRGWSGYGPPPGLPDRLLGRRGVAGLGPRRAAAPRDGGAEVLLPGKGYARRGCGSRDPWLRLALRPARPGRWGAGDVSISPPLRKKPPVLLLPGRGWVLCSSPGLV